MHFSPLEFHLTRAAREAFRFDQDLVRHQRPDLEAVQELALQMNERGKSVRPSDLFALVLLQQMFHRVIELYAQEQQPRLFDLALAQMTERLGDREAEQTLIAFAETFPPLPVFLDNVEVRQFLRTYSHGRSNRDMLIEQMMLVHVGNRNPATGVFKELFDDTAIPSRVRHEQAIQSLRALLKGQPTFGKLGMTLFDLLESPFRVSPGSLAGQLRYIAEQWGLPLDDDLRRLLLFVEDLMREDDARRGPPGPGFTPKIEAWTHKRGDADLPERYTADTEWMPRAVLIAKSVYVWLDQLSKEYQREVKRLDQIPDEELAKLAAWGFTALWLIGLWERSKASERIKHLHGNIEAAASAYSLYDYVISAELGGEAALENLRRRAMQYGIRLACDVVPNHMGIDSRWVIEHPDWFIQLDHPPYPSYRFTGPDLSSDSRVSIRLEDGYWNRTDAAVVFERRDNWTGDVRYIYHGNDGTQMPWNDTAQLNFLLPEVRHAVTEQILNVARRFSLIRFDAAMTLTQMHYQRLWFPEPGTAGAIPSRSWFGMTKEEFDRAMPTEFWREVVDRVNSEAPDTLLLAEAFWLTEGLFVRTLGMHRVYNSAFMNMLKQEKNGDFRRLLKNVLTYDARILERYVNFMNNPDEDTAIEQFGTDDKYFGVAMMMSTLPGLPMFGHGQVEGLREKYGHEYRRAYHDEAPNERLIERHEREIFPLLRFRARFSSAATFALHDFVTPEGHVAEDVFAYTNRAGHSHTLAVYHNRYAETRGWVRLAHDGRTLASELNLHPRAGMFCIFRDLISGLEYIESSDKLVHVGFYLELRAFAYHVFSEFREVEDREGRYRQVAERLSGQGTSSVDREVQRIVLQPLITAFTDFASAETFRELIQGATGRDHLHKVFAERAVPFLDQAKFFAGGDRSAEEVAEQFGIAVACVLDHERQSHAKAAVDPHQPEPRLLATWAAISQLGLIRSDAGAPKQAARWVGEWFLDETLVDTMVLLGAEHSAAEREVLLARILTAYQDLASSFHGPRRFAHVIEMLHDPLVRECLHVHRYRGVDWFNAEAMGELLRHLTIVTEIRLEMNSAFSAERRTDERREALHEFEVIQDLAAISEYEVGRLEKLLGYAARKDSQLLV